MSNVASANCRDIFRGTLLVERVAIPCRRTTSDLPTGEKHMIVERTIVGSSIKRRRFKACCRRGYGRRQHGNWGGGREGCEHDVEKLLDRHPRLHGECLVSFVQGRSPAASSKVSERRDQREVGGWFSLDYRINLIYLPMCSQFALPHT